MVIESLQPYDLNIRLRYPSVLIAGGAGLNSSRSVQKSCVVEFVRVVMVPGLTSGPTSVYCPARRQPGVPVDFDML